MHQDSPASLWGTRRKKKDIKAATVSNSVSCGCVSVWVWVGVGGCMHVCVSTCAVLYIRNYICSTSRKKCVHIVKLLMIIIHWTCSCYVLFISYVCNKSPRQIPVHIFMSLANKYPCILKTKCSIELIKLKLILVQS